MRFSTVTTAVIAGLAASAAAAPVDNPALVKREFQGDVIEKRFAAPMLGNKEDDYWHDNSYGHDDDDKKNGHGHGGRGGHGHKDDHDHGHRGDKDDHDHKHREMARMIMTMGTEMARMIMTISTEVIKESEAIKMITRMIMAMGTEGTRMIMTISTEVTKESEAIKMITRMIMTMGTATAMAMAMEAIAVMGTEVVKMIMAIGTATAMAMEAIAVMGTEMTKMIMAIGTAMEKEVTRGGMSLKYSWNGGWMNRIRHRCLAVFLVLNFQKACRVWYAIQAGQTNLHYIFRDSHSNSSMNCLGFAELQPIQSLSRDE
ncbi:hypothetical protein VTO42DRAFT_8734 [Malbranchea cinnamomea]